MVAEYNDPERFEALSFLIGVIDSFFGNKKSPNHKEIVANMVKSYKKLECNISANFIF